MLSSGAKRMHDYYSSCMFYLGAIIVMLLTQALAGAFGAALDGVVPDITKNGDFNTAFMIAVQLLTAVYIVLFGKFSKRTFNFTVINENRKTKPHFSVFVVPAVCAVVLMCAMFLPTIWYGYFTRYVLGISPEASQINLTTTSSVVMIVIASVFLAPICEEAVYRGVLFNGLKSECSVSKAVLLSALAFVLMHMSPVQIVFQFALGVLSAFIMYRTGRLISCAILHSCANALALTVELTPLGGVLGACVDWMTHNIAAAVFITLALFVAGWGLLFVLVKFCLKERAEPAQTDYAEQKTEDEILAAVRKKDGKIWYIIGVSICAALLIINTAVSAL